MLPQAVSLVMEQEKLIQLLGLCLVAGGKKLIPTILHNTSVTPKIPSDSSSSVAERFTLSKPKP